MRTLLILFAYTSIALTAAYGQKRVENVAGVYTTASTGSTSKNIIRISTGNDYTSLTLTDTGTFLYKSVFTFDGSPPVLSSGIWYIKDNKVILENDSAFYKKFEQAKRESFKKVTENDTAIVIGLGRDDIFSVTVYQEGEVKSTYKNQTGSMEGWFYKPIVIEEKYADSLKIYLYPGEYTVQRRINSPGLYVYEKKHEYVDFNKQFTFDNNLLMEVNKKSAWVKADY